MSTLINEIDARTRLAGANQMELLLFKLGTNEIFGINVFKVREVMKLPELTQIPEADSRIVGMANIRGIMVPVVGLKRSLGLGTENEGRVGGPPGTNPYLIVSEYNGSLQGFLSIGSFASHGRPSRRHRRLSEKTTKARSQPSRCLRMDAWSSFWTWKKC